VELGSPSSSSRTTSTMASRNGSAAATMGPTSFSYPHDVPNIGEREPLLSQHTGGAVENLSIRQALLSDAWEIAQRNTGLLLIVAAQAFFSVVDAIVKILHNVDPPMTTMQVRLKFQYQSLLQYPDLPHELITIRMIITYISCMIYMCVRSQILLRLVFASFE
jgi:hypothetical protein